MEPAAEVIRRSFATVASRFSLTRENCPGNGAFITAERLKGIIEAGARLFCAFVKSDAPAEGAASCGAPLCGPLAGCVLAKKKNEEIWRLEKIAVLPDYRRQGCGSALLAHAEAYIKEQGGSKISISIIARHDELRRWYEKAGFGVTGCKTFASVPFTVCCMEKSLRP